MVTKCIAAFIATLKDLLCSTLFYVTLPEPPGSDPRCSHILRSDMKEKVLNKSVTEIFGKKSQRKVNKKQQPLFSWAVDSCEDFMKNIIANSDDQKLVYRYGNK